MAKNQAREREGSYITITLYHYFSTKADMLLYDPRGALAKQVQSTRITSANEEVRPLLEAPDQRVGQSANRGLYTKCTPEQKAEI